MPTRRKTASQKEATGHKAATARKAVEAPKKVQTEHSAATGNTSTGSLGEKSLVTQTINDIYWMSDFILSEAINVSSDLMADAYMITSAAGDVPENTKSGDDLDFKKIASVHRGLAAVIAPLFPETLRDRSLARKKNRLIFVTMVIAAVSFIGLAVTLSILEQRPSVLASPADIAAASSVPATAAEEPFLSIKMLQLMIALFGAAVGAILYNVVELYRVLQSGAFRITYEITYHQRFGLGILTGFVLAKILSGDPHTGENTNPMTLAILGGFSSELVISILNKLVETTRTTFLGDNPVRRQEELDAERQRADQRDTRSKLELAGELSKAMSTLPDDGTAAATKSMLEDMIKRNTHARD